MLSQSHIGALVAATFALLSAACSGYGDEPHRLFGVSLGLAASQTRSAFEAPGQGAWTTITEPALSLVWMPSDRTGSSSLRGPVVFEFHEGRLVAMRALLDASAPLADGMSLNLRPISLLARERTPDGAVSIRVLARDCPTHAREVEAVLRGTRGSR